MPFNHSFRLMRTYIAAVMFSTSFAAPLVAQTGDQARDRVASAVANLVDISKIRIENFGRIDGTFYRGSQPKDQDYADLAALGIKTMINLTSDDVDETEESLAQQAGMKYVQIPMNTRVVPTPAELAQFMKIVTDPASQPIYLHCVGGRHRTGVMTAVYRMTHDGWNADQAFKEMKKYKFGSDFLHPEFKKFVYTYATTLANAAAASPAVTATTKAVAGGGK